MDIQLSFERLVSDDFTNACFDDVKCVALAIWYDGFIPNVERLDSGSARSSCYLIDRLMRYNCVSYEHQQQLLTIINLLVTKFNITTTVLTDLGKVDKSAAKWGLSSDLKTLLKLMLPYQTRHYARMYRSSIN